MASKRPYDPVMHCTPKEYNAVSMLAQNILTNGIYANPLVFNNPNVTQFDYYFETSQLKTLIIEARGDTNKRRLRNSKCKTVFNLSTQLLIYVKLVANHDVNIITLSGFELNNQGAKSQPPRQPVILRIVEGKASGTYKVYLKRISNKPDVHKDPQTHQRDVKYTIEITLTPEIEASWKVVQHSVASTKLIFSEITLNARNYIRVYGKNASGTGQPSSVYAFTPQ